MSWIINILHSCCKCCKPEENINVDYLINSKNNINREKLIFLDIDGVLNSNEYYNSTLITHGKTLGVSDKLLNLFKKVVEKTNAKIILSSNWRLSYEKLIEIKRELFKIDTYISDITPDLNKIGDRVDEILLWLKKNNKKSSKWVAIDDMNLLFMNNKLHKNNFVKINPEIGLTEKNCQDIIYKLNYM